MGICSNHSIICGIFILLASALQVCAEPSVSEWWGQSIEAETNGDYALALELHEKILPEMEKSYIAQLRAGWLQYMNRNYTEALDHYEAAAEQSSDALSPLYGALNCHVAMLNNSRAIKVAKAILTIDDQNYVANKQLAATYYQEGGFPLSANYYRKLNRLYPEDLDVASGLAWSYLKQGEFRQARPLFEGILMIRSDYAYARQGLEICDRVAKR